MKISNEALEALRQHLKPENLGTQTVRFFGSQGCCGPAVQMAVVEEVPETDETFTVADIRFAVDPSVKEQLEPVTLAAGPQGFRLDGFQSSGCC
jgi:Fe-S cluster assembly iron-binding protein IscA